MKKQINKMNEKLKQVYFEDKLINTENIIL